MSDYGTITATGKVLRDGSKKEFSVVNRTPDDLLLGDRVVVGGFVSKPTGLEVVRNLSAEKRWSKVALEQKAAVENELLASIEGIPPEPYSGEPVRPVEPPQTIPQPRMISTEEVAFERSSNYGGNLRVVIYRHGEVVCQKATYGDIINYVDESPDGYRPAGSYTTKGISWSARDITILGELSEEELAKISEAKIVMANVEAQYAAAITVWDAEMDALKIARAEWKKARDQWQKDETAWLAALTPGQRLMYCQSLASNPVSVAKAMRKWDEDPWGVRVALINGLTI